MNAERVVLLAEAVLAQDFGAGVIVPEKLYALISPAIKHLQNRLLENNRAKLENFRFPHRVTCVSGVGSLLSAADEGLRIDLMKMANIKIESPDNPLLKTVQMVDSFERFGGGSIQDAFVILGYVEGTKILIRDGAAASAAGGVGVDPTTSFNKSLIINSITVPKTVDELSEELEADLIESIVYLAKQEVPARRRAVDVAEQKT